MVFGIDKLFTTKFKLDGLTRTIKNAEWVPTAQAKKHPEGV